MESARPPAGDSFTDMTETEASHLVRQRKSAVTEINLCCLGDRALPLRVIKDDLIQASGSIRDGGKESSF